MEIRLNKLISEAGVCSRREADNFIEMERVTVNGKQPHVGQKVTAEDVVLVDGERLNVEGGWKSKTAKLTDEEKLLRDALRPKFGKALSKSAVAQRIAANPKSAALRKTSKNNPINKAKRAAHRKNRNHEGDE